MHLTALLNKNCAVREREKKNDRVREKKVGHKKSQFAEVEKAELR